MNNAPLKGESKTGKELTPQKLTPVKGDINFVTTNCSLNQCIDKFDSVVRIAEKTVKGNPYYAYYHVCNSCDRRHMSSRNKTDTAESKRRADLGYREVEE
jgi:hypothetical protein